MPLALILPAPRSLLPRRPLGTEQVGREATRLTRSASPSSPPPPAHRGVERDLPHPTPQAASAPPQRPGR
jgi:hypothetical protein